MTDDDEEADVHGCFGTDVLSFRDMLERLEAQLLAEGETRLVMTLPGATWDWQRLQRADLIAADRLEGEDMPLRDTLEYHHARLLAAFQDELMIATSGGVWHWQRSPQ